MKKYYKDSLKYYNKNTNKEKNKEKNKNSYELIF